MPRPIILIVTLALLTGCTTVTLGPRVSLDDQVSGGRELPLNLYSASLATTDFTSAKVTVLPDLASLLPADADRVRINRQTRDLLVRLDGGLDADSGMLIRVRAYSNGLAPPTLPFDFLIPMGVGFDPVDAYSEHMNLTTVRFGAPRSDAVDQGYFVWIQKVGPRRFMIGSLPRSHDAAFQIAARDLADRKVELRQAGRTIETYRLPDYAARAAFWNERMREAEDRFQSQERRQAAANLVTRYQQAQQEHTRLLQMEAERQRRRKNGGGFLATAGTILQIGKSVVSNWPAVAAFFDDKPIVRDQRALATEIGSLQSRSRAADQTIRQTEAELSRVPELQSAA